MLDNAATRDFAQRQARNRRIGAVIVLWFLLFFFVVGASVDYLYLGAPSRPAERRFPWARLGPGVLGGGAARLVLRTLLRLVSRR